MIELPGAFLRRIEQAMAPDEFAAFVHSLELPAVTSVRYNPRKPVVPMAGAEPVPWCSTGYYLPQKPVFTLDPLFHAGCYYPQEASSMVLCAILKQLNAQTDKDLKVLDLCGAPGGKSTLIASFLDGNGLLVTNEVIPSRAVILKENILKWGASNVMVTRSNPAEFSALSGFFDVMLVDAPCSGEGMFRKGETARGEWSPENAAMCSLRQRDILLEAWDALKKDGWLIYSTCTFNPGENEENLRWLASKVKLEVASLNFPPQWGTTPVPLLDGTARAFYPHKTKGEGFFVALMQKKEAPPRKNLHNTRKIKPARLPQMAEHLLKANGRWHFAENEGEWNAIPVSYKYEIQAITEQLNVLSVGVPLGKPARKEWLPSHALAMSRDVSADFPMIGLSLEEALKYLKGEALMPHPGMRRGFYLVSYRNHPLGFVKNIGNRLNNLYPKEWRIRMKI